MRLWANSADPDQTAQMISLIRVFTVCYFICIFGCNSPFLTLQTLSLSVYYPFLSTVKSVYECCLSGVVSLPFHHANMSP